MTTVGKRLNDLEAAARSRSKRPLLVAWQDPDDHKQYFFKPRYGNGGKRGEPVSLAEVEKRAKGYDNLMIVEYVDQARRDV